MEEYYLICEDSLEGIFTGIYDAYLKKKPHEQVHLCVGEEENYRLFAVYEECRPDETKAMKVARTIGRKLGTEAYMSICRALASPEADKAEAVYKTVVVGLSMQSSRGCGSHTASAPARGQVMGNLKNPFVHRVFELARFTANEAHYHVEFLRFRELENGILYAPIGPKNNVITFIVPHFADRLPLENFVIHDTLREIYALHPAGGEWYLVSGGQEPWNNGLTGDNATCDSLTDDRFNFSQEEKKYSELFTHFFHTIAIKERRNGQLQRNMLPLRYRKYMTEFQGK